jgi:serine/threonine-protein kinase
MLFKRGKGLPSDDTSSKSDTGPFGAILREVARADDVAPPAPDPLLGVTLDHYRVVSLLGRGGMGVVYRAEDLELRRAVALKVLPPSVAGDVERRRRFVREARAAAAVSHPNIAAVYEAGESGGHAFLVMELVEGETLRAKLRLGKLVAEEAVRVAVGIARGLARAHEKNIVHRDLKPENVMITPGGEVKILDFGLAKVREAQAASDAADSLGTEHGRLVGTPGYMSPEQVNGTPVDARSDVFALGVVLYEMLTGVLPFAGETPLERVAALQRDEPARLNRDVGGALARVVARCLRKKRDERFASAEEVVAALEQLGDVSRRPALVRVAAAAALVLLVALGAFAYRARARSASRGESYLDLPPPSTSVAEAAHEFALGMGALREVNDQVALQHFERAADLDPSMAAAHLRIAMTHYITDVSPEKCRAPFARAAELRRRLSARDQAVMSALEPVLQRAQPDSLEAARRIQALSEDDPRDVELLDWQVFLRGEVPATLPLQERAIGLDPGDGQALQFLGMTLSLLGRYDEGREALERCTALSVTTADCLCAEGWIDMIAGRCADFERDARRLVDRSPAYGHPLLASALVANGRPPAAAREECALTVATLPEPDRRLTELALDAQLALVAGDFATARDLAGKEAEAVAAHPTARGEYMKHYRPTMQLLSAALEEGDESGARRIAQDFADRRQSWARFVSFNGGVDLSAFIDHLVPGDFEPKRRGWIEAWTTAGAYKGLVWPYAFAAPASTPDEARAALASLPDYAPLTSYVTSMWIFFGDIGIPDAAIGHVFVLAGDHGGALPYLRHAASSCADFDAPLAHTRALLDLGVALEATGDKAGACDAYAKVLARWGQAKPRSVTAEAARARASKLGCP